MELIKLWNSQDFTYDKLVEQMRLVYGVNITRNVVSGRPHRASAAGLYIWRPGGPANITKAASERSSGGHKPKGPTKPRNRKPKQPAEPKISTVRRQKAQQIAVGPDSPVTLERAQATRGCRFPYGEKPEMLFCGAQTIEGGSYCDFHQSMCYKSPDHQYDDKKIARWFK